MTAKLSHALTEDQTQRLKNGMYRVQINLEGKILVTSVSTGKIASGSTIRQAIEALS